MGKLDYERRGGRPYGLNRELTPQPPQSRQHVPTNPTPVEVIDSQSGEVVAVFATVAEAHAFVASQSFGMPTTLEIRH